MTLTFFPVWIDTSVIYEWHWGFFPARLSVSVLDPSIWPNQIGISDWFNFGRLSVIYVWHWGFFPARLSVRKPLFLPRLNGLCNRPDLSATSTDVPHDDSDVLNQPDELLRQIGVLTVQLHQKIRSYKRLIRDTDQTASYTLPRSIQEVGTRLTRTRARCRFLNHLNRPISKSHLFYLS